MSGKGPRESEIVEQCIRALRRAGAIVRKRHGTAFGVAGDPDIYGCYRGRHFEIEVKRPGCEPTTLQSHRLEEWRKHGSEVAVVTSQEDALEVLACL